jgi:autotransporter passenger strand-loop-strand repeat protein
VNSGGNENVTGNGAPDSAVASGSIVSAGGTETLTSGGVELGGTVSAGGTLSAGSGGMADGVKLRSGTLSVTTSGTADGTIVNAGGNEDVTGNGAVASGSKVGTRGTETLSAGGVELGGTVSGGTVNVASGGVASGEQVTSGTISVTAGGTADATSVQLGGQEVVTGSGAVASGSNIGANGTETITSGGEEEGGTVTALGTVSVGSGGTISGETIAAGGTATLAAGATASNTTLSGGTLVLSSGADASGSIDFAGSGGTLVIDGTTFPTGTISGFSGGSGDAIIFSGLAYNSGATVSASGNTLVITDGGSSYTLNLSGVSSPTPDYTLVNDGGVLELMPCYAAGTHILTSEGEVLVEALQVGDTVITVREGGPAMRKVVWTGRRAIEINRHPDPELVRPVRIIAGAFGPGVPERDLRLSPQHAVYVDGHFFEAISLVNDMTVVVEHATQHVTYHHIELDGHDVMLAEGLPAESFLDTGNKNMFEHASAPMMLHADFRPQGDEGFCVPMVREGERLEAVRAMLIERANDQALNVITALKKTA